MRGDARRASTRWTGERLGEGLAVKMSDGLPGEPRERNWSADLFLRGRCGGGTAPDGKTTALAMPIDTARSPPGDEGVAESLCLGDELEESGDRGECVEIDCISRSLVAGGDEGVTGAELLNAAALVSKKGPFGVCLLCAKFPAL
jgi:hypothetical protein